MKYLFLLIISFPLLAMAQHSPYFYQYQRLDASTAGLSLQPDGRFGTGVVAIGDLDGDGVSEWLVVACGAEATVCSVIFPDKEGNPLRIVQQAPPTWQGQGETPGGRIGQAMWPAGDLDGDGSLELWVGEPLGKEGPLAYGALWLWSVNEAGQITATSRWGGRSEAFLTKLTLEGRLGAGITALSDNLLAVAAPVPSGKGVGKVFVLSHNAGQNLRIARVIGEGEEAWLSELRSSDQFGASICSPGDLDGDGGNDLLISSPEDDAAGQGKGALHLLFLSPAGQSVAHQKLTPGDRGMKLPLNPDDRFGSAMAVISPLADSSAQIAVAAIKDDDGGKDRGAIYVMTLHKAGNMIAWHKISEATYNFEGELGPKHSFGYSLAAAGDHNQDGRPDLLVGGPGDQNDLGAAWLLLPSAWPDRLKDTAQWLGSLRLSSGDSAAIYRDAHTRDDSALIEKTYNLEEYAVNHLVFVLDVSASMNKPDRLPLLKQALLDLLPYMRPEDLISIITYSGNSEVLLEAVPAEARDVITETLQGMKSSGETKPGKALKDALNIAEKHFIEGGNNRIIFGTDGGFDQADIEKSMAMITASRVVMSVFYFGKLPQNRIVEMTQIAAQTGGNAAHIAGNSARGALLRESKVVGKAVAN
ncbi:MAG: VWA domain-containing protein [Bacteroidia bacterium]|nr:VWA domain-containing protein [Bacteroidia bacterium]